MSTEPKPEVPSGAPAMSARGEALKTVIASLVVERKQFDDTSTAIVRAIVEHLGLTHADVERFREEAEDRATIHGFKPDVAWITRHADALATLLEVSGDTQVVTNHPDCVGASAAPTP